MKLMNIIGVTLLAVLATSTAHAHSVRDIKSKVIGHVGGTKLWEECRYVHFVFNSERDGKLTGKGRDHTWDRYTGRYVLKYEDENGNAIRIFFNVNTRQGTVLKNGMKVEGEEAEQKIERAYRAFINDTYWLLMPTKLNDPGVIVTFKGHGDADQYGNRGPTWWS